MRVPSCWYNSWSSPLDNCSGHWRSSGWADWPWRPQRQPRAGSIMNSESLRPNLLKPVRDDADGAILNSCQCRLRQRLHFHKPLLRYKRFDDFASSLRPRHSRSRLFHLGCNAVCLSSHTKASHHRKVRRTSQTTRCAIVCFKKYIRRSGGQNTRPASGKANYLHVLPNFLSRVEAVHSAVCSGVVIQRGIFVHDVDHLEVVSLTQLVVVNVMAGRDLESPSPELTVDVFVADNGNLPLGAEGDLGEFSNIFGVPGVESISKSRTTFLGAFETCTGIDIRKLIGSQR